MPWDGSGNFTRTDGTRQGSTAWEQARQAAVNVNAGDHDAHDEDIVDGMENCLTRDGQNSPSTDLPMAAHKHTGVGDADANDQYATYGQLVSLVSPFVSPANVGGTANAITLTPTPAVTAHVVGRGFAFIVEANNTGAVTLAVSGLSAVPLRKANAAAFGAGELADNRLVRAIWDGTRYLTDVITVPTSVDISAVTTELAAAPDDTDRLAAMDDDDSDTTKYLTFSRLKSWARSVVRATDVGAPAGGETADDDELVLFQGWSVSPPF